MRQLTETQDGPSIFPSISVLNSAISLLFIQIVIILSVCRTLAVFGHYLHQPIVVFEIIGGILLGPSIFGIYQPYTQNIFPVSSLHLVEVIASFGLQIYLFLVGMELDLELLVLHSRSTSIIAFSGMIVPFAFGIAISVPIYNIYINSTTEHKKPSFITFAVFIGTAMSITALPVLARILREHSLLLTRPGFIALGAAVITDAVAWILLVIAIALATASNAAIAGWIFFAIVLYTIFMFTLGRIALHYLVFQIERWSVSEVTMNNLLTLAVILLFLSGWIVSQVGIDPIVGSFIFGVIIPRPSRLYKVCTSTLDNFVVTLLLPLYFALSGLRTNLTVLRAYPDLWVLLAVCASATLGKVLGAGIAALACSVPFREACVIAVLMNTRGLVELIVLNIGNEFHVLDDHTFSIMVIMCLFTTFITCPILYCIYPESKRQVMIGIVQGEAVTSRRENSDLDSNNNDIEEDVTVTNNDHRDMNNQQSLFASSSGDNNNNDIIIYSSNTSESSNRHHRNNSSYYHNISRRSGSSDIDNPSNSVNGSSSISSSCKIEEFKEECKDDTGLVTNTVIATGSSVSSDIEENNRY